MERIPLKTAMCVIFCALGAIGLSGCVEPVSLASFIEDPEVLEFIEKGAGTVSILTGSEPNLKAGNKKITGLDPGKYYMVEEWDESGSPVGVPQFVSASGERTANLTGIGAVSGGEITGLTNRYQYKVTAARPLPVGNVPYSVIPSGGGNATNSGGTIILPGPTDNGTFIYTLTLSSYSSYEIVEVPVSPAGSTGPALTTSDGIITLLRRETVNDYVFFQDTSNFYVLKVGSDQVLGPIPPEGDPNLYVIVSFTLNPDQTFTLSQNTVSFSQATLLTAGSKVITVTLNTASAFDTGSIKWTYNAGQSDARTWTGTALSIDFADPANIDLLVIGRYTITIEATADGVPYNSSLELVINP